MFVPFQGLILYPSRSNGDEAGGAGRDSIVVRKQQQPSEPRCAAAVIITSAELYKYRHPSTEAQRRIMILV